MAKIPPVKGTRDFYPEKMALRNWILSGWQSISLRNGFLEYDGPIFEHLQLFTQKSGEGIASELFSLTDRGGRDLAIRPEMTPTLARMVNQQFNALPKPIKWFSMPRCCRAEKPQKGRLREFFQWNCDIVGTDSTLADAECIFTAVDYLRSVGLTAADIVVRLSSRAMLAALLADLKFNPDEFEKVYVLLDKRPKLSAEAFAELAAEQIPNPDQREKLMQVQSLQSLKDVGELLHTDQARAALAGLSELFDQLNQLGIADYCQFDITIVRGLAYYTGPVFEIFDRQSRLRAVAAGGRYDNLLAGFGGPQASGTGFGMGDVVLEILLTEKDLLKPKAAEVDFFLIDAEPKLFDQLLQVTAQLRQAGLTAAFDYRRTSIGKQLKQASALNTRFVIILGAETIESNMVTIKDMAQGTQSQILLNKLLDNPRQVL